MMMQLQRHRRAGFTDQALHLEALAVIDAVVAAPGPEHFAMQRSFVAALLLELRRPAPSRPAPGPSAPPAPHPWFRRRRDPSGPRRRPGGWSTAGSSRAYPRSARRRRARCRRSSRGNRFVQRRPGADVAPAGIERHDHAVLGLLHDRVVERIAADTRRTPWPAGA